MTRWPNSKRCPSHSRFSQSIRFFLGVDVLALLDYLKVLPTRDGSCPGMAYCGDATRALIL